MGLLRPILLGAALIGVLVAAAAAQPAPPAAEPAAQVAVRFLDPAPPGLILGPTRIVVEAIAPAGARIARVEIYADGTLLTVFERPPFSLTWDAGTGFAHRTLRAVATDSEGRKGEATLVARPLYVGQYEEVRLVNVFATVRDRRGNAVLDLGKSDFVLLEDGDPQTVTHFTSAKVPITIALLIDASNSMNLGGRIDLARKAAEEFVESVDPEDRLVVLSFNDDLTGGAEPAADRGATKKAIEAIQAKGGTALYDAIYTAAGRLLGSEGRPAAV